MYTLSLSSTVTAVIEIATTTTIDSAFLLNYLNGTAHNESRGS